MHPTYETDEEVKDTTSNTTSGVARPMPSLNRAQRRAIEFKSQNARSWRKSVRTAQRLRRGAR